jgi:hypothetical protein
MGSNDVTSKLSGRPVGEIFPENNQCGLFCWLSGIGSFSDIPVLVSGGHIHVVLGIHLRPRGILWHSIFIEIMLLNRIILEYSKSIPRIFSYLIFIGPILLLPKYNY